MLGDLPRGPQNQARREHRSASRAQKDAAGLPLLRTLAVSGRHPSPSPLPGIKGSGISHSRGLQIPAGPGALDPATGPRATVPAVRHVSSIRGVPSAGVRLVQRLGVSPLGITAKPNAAHPVHGPTHTSRARTPHTPPNPPRTAPLTPLTSHSPLTAHCPTHRARLPSPHTAPVYPTHPALSHTAPLAPHKTLLAPHCPAHSAEPRLPRSPRSAPPSLPPPKGEPAGGSERGSGARRPLAAPDRTCGADLRYPRYIRYPRYSRCPRGGVRAPFPLLRDSSSPWDSIVGLHQCRPNTPIVSHACSSPNYPYPSLCRLCFLCKTSHNKLCALLHTPNAFHSSRQL